MTAPRSSLSDAHLQSVLAHLNLSGAAAERVGAGVTSVAFKVQHESGARIVRISDSTHAAECYAKDAAVARHCAATSLPIPRVTASGMVDRLYYCESTLLPGVPFNVVDASEVPEVAAELGKTLVEIWAAPAIASGAGRWRLEDGEARCDYDNWHDVLAAPLSNGPDQWSPGWQRTVKEVGCARELGYLTRSLRRHLERLPQIDARLIHGDFSADNVLVENRRVSGVLDWANSAMGDPAYDIAWLRYWDLSFGDGGVKCADVVEASLPGEYVESPSWDERVHAAVISIALDITRWRCVLGADDVKKMIEYGVDVVAVSERRLTERFGLGA